MHLSSAKEEYINHLKTQGYAKKSIRTRESSLDQLIFFLKEKDIYHIESITKRDIDAYQKHLISNNYKTNSYRHALIILRGFFLYQTRNNYLLINPAQNIRLPRKELTLPKDILTEKEMTRFLSLPNIKTSEGIRDRAILELLYSSGIRACELSNLDLYDVDFTRGQVRVKGKGNRERIVPLGKEARYRIGKYIREIRETSNQKESALFLSCFHGSRITTDKIQRLIQKYREQAHIKKKVTPHTFRHTCATHMLQNGANLRYIQELLGHQSLRSTQIYTHIVNKDLDACYEETHPAAKSKKTDTILREEVRYKGNFKVEKKPCF